jgi:hypothetical protein
VLVRLPLAAPGDPIQGAVAEADDDVLRRWWDAWTKRWSTPTRRPARGRVRRAGPATPLVGAVAVLALVAVVLVFWRTDSLWRADHKVWVGARVHEIADYEAAIEINPWEPRYDFNIARILAGPLKSPTSAANTASLLDATAYYFDRAVRLDPYVESAQLDYAGVLIEQAQKHLGNVAVLRQEALAALREAHQDNPFDTRVSSMRRKEEALPS